MHTDLKQQIDAIGSRLRHLPDELEPPMDWRTFKARSQTRHAARPVTPKRMYAAIAAVLVVGVCGVLVTEQWRLPARPADPTRKPLAATGRPQTRGITSADQSRQIESWLASLPEEPIVVRVGTRAAAAGLEDRIAQVDDLLTAVQLAGTGGDRLAALQHERVQLVGSLAQVRYAEVVASQSP